MNIKYPGYKPSKDSKQRNIHIRFLKAIEYIRILYDSKFSKHKLYLSCDKKTKALKFPCFFVCP